MFKLIKIRDSSIHLHSLEEKKETKDWIMLHQDQPLVNWFNT